VGSDRHDNDEERWLDRFSERVDRKERRKLEARRHRQEGMWFGIGMFGLVGWSVVVPTLIGVALGMWIDATWPSQYSWTLMMLFAGVVAGCFNAWYWVKRESRR
jgi:ATP synthase protein I